MHQYQRLLCGSRHRKLLLFLGKLRLHYASPCFPWDTRRYHSGSTIKTPDERTSSYILLELLFATSGQNIFSLTIFWMYFLTAYSITPHYCSTMKSLMVSRAVMVSWNRAALVKLLFNVIPFHSRTFELTFVS